MFTYTSILLQFERPLKLWSTLLTFSSNFSQFHPTFRRIPERLGRPPCLYTWHKATEEGLDMLWHQEGSNMSEGATFLLCLCLTFDTVTQQPTGEGTGRRDTSNYKSHTFLPQNYLYKLKQQQITCESTCHLYGMKAARSLDQFHTNNCDTGKRAHDTNICSVCLAYAGYCASTLFYGCTQQFSSSYTSLDYCVFSPPFSGHTILSFFFHLSHT